MAIDNMEERVCLYHGSSCMGRRLDEIIESPEYVTGYWVRIVEIKNHDGTPDDTGRQRHVWEYGAMVIHEGAKTPEHRRALFLYFSPDGRAYWYLHTTSGEYKIDHGQIQFKSKNKIYIMNVLHFGDYIPTLGDIVAGMTPDYNGTENQL